MNVAKVLLLSSSFCPLLVGLNQSVSTFRSYLRELGVLVRGTGRENRKSNALVFFIVHTFCGFKSK